MPIEQTTTRRQHEVRNTELIDEFDRLEAELENEETQVDEDEAPRSRERLSQVQHRGSGSTPRVSAGELDTLVTGQQEEALNELKAEIERSSAVESMKEEYLDKVNELLNKVKKGQLEDSSEIDDLKSEFETSMNETPGPASRLFKFLKEDQVSGVTKTSVETALKNAGLTKSDLNNIQLPPGKDLCRKLIQALKQADPKLTSAFSAETGNPYNDAVRSRLTSLIQALVGGEMTVNDQTVISILDQGIDLPWDGSKIQTNIRGTWSKDDSVKLFEKVNQAMSSGQDSDWKKASDDINSRGIGGAGAHMHNDHARRIAAALYYTAHQNPYLFRRLVQQMKSTFVQDLIGTLREDRGERTEIQAGDVWHSDDSAKMLEWALGPGGTPPHLATTTTSQNGTPQSSS